MYTSLARVYDRLMDDIDYAAWARRYLDLVTRVGGRVETVLECACGTGALTADLASLGLRVTASDISEEMLSEAAARLRRKGLRLPLVCQDMRSLQVPRPVDAVIACCDGANYLLSDADLLAFLRSARAALRPGGALAFDVSSRGKLAAMDGQVFCDERDDAACIWRGRWQEDRGLLTLEVSLYLRGEGGLYRRAEERHVQRGYSEEELLRLLAEAGFESPRLWGDDMLSPPAPGCSRVYCTAVAPQG